VTSFGAKQIIGHESDKPKGAQKLLYKDSHGKGHYFIRSAERRMIESPKSNTEMIITKPKKRKGKISGGCLFCLQIFSGAEHPGGKRTCAYACSNTDSEAINWMESRPSARPMPENLNVPTRCINEIVKRHAVIAIIDGQLISESAGISPLSLNPVDLSFFYNVERYWPLNPFLRNCIRNMFQLMNWFPILV